jgi:tripartite-type tricarboxylate transporter receptor subunit TctC
MYDQINRRNVLKLGAAGTVLMATGIRASAQAYPSRPVTLMCGYSAGGPLDNSARIFAESWAQTSGQRILVENRAGPGGLLATAAVIQARPDGYTLLYSANGQLTVNQHTVPNIPIDAVANLRHICMLTESPYVIGMSKDVPANSFQELVELAKKEPGSIKYATSGAGTSGHLGFALMVKLAGVDMVPVHYKGGQNQMQDLLANQVQLGFNLTSIFGTYFKSGQLKPLFVTSDKRIPEFPDIPSATEVGLAPLAKMRYWTGLHAPKDTPDDVAAAIREQARAAMNSDFAKEKLKAAAQYWVDDTPEAFVERINAESEVMAQAAEAAGIKVEN